tara:strand:+ start:61 stop:297 length:237 start_codon:yes stop_codon:yes gene_type:complete
MITLNITREEGERLATLLSTITGIAGGKAINNPDYDAIWHQWQPLSKKVANALGYEAYLNPNDIKNIQIDIDLMHSIG